MRAQPASRSSHFAALLTAIVVAFFATPALADSSFAYQGRIRKDGFLVNGPTDLRFTLWTAANGGSQVGPQQDFVGVPVDKGLFALALDFGPNAFAGQPRWVQLAVRHPAGSGEYVMVTPRQPMTSTPYSLFSLAGGEWTRIGANVHYSDGNVGIGTASPGAKLDVAGGSIRTTGQLISTVTTGTAPLQVTSTTVVPNLNAALLGGLASAEYGRLASGQTWTGANTFSASGNSFTGNGSGLTALNASSIATGTISNARTTATVNNTNQTIVLRGTSGQFSAGAITATSFTGSGGGLTGLNASNISSGTISNARTTGTANSTANTLVLRNSSGSFSANVITANQLSAPSYMASAAENAGYALNSPAKQYSIRIGGGNQDRLQFFDDSAGTSRMAIYPNGRVSINTVVPDERLHVDGNVKANQFISGSDRRLKKDIVPIRDGLRVVRALDGVRYRLIVQPDDEADPGTQVGFVAQQVQTVLPDVVSQNSSGFLAMDYSRLTPVLVEAVKELHAELLDRDETIAAQSDELVILRDRLDALEHLVHRLAQQNGAAER